MIGTRAVLKFAKSCYKLRDSLVFPSTQTTRNSLYTTLLFL